LVLPAGVWFWGDGPHSFMFSMVLDQARPYKKITLSKLNCRESHQGNA